MGRHVVIVSRGIVVEAERHALLDRMAFRAARGLEIAACHPGAQLLIALAVPDFLDRRFLDVSDRQVDVFVSTPITARRRRAGAVYDHLLPGDMATWNNLVLRNRHNASAG